MKQKDSEKAGEVTNTLCRRVLYNYWHAVTVKQVNRITGRDYQLEPLKGLNAPSRKPNFLVHLSNSQRERILPPKGLRFVTKETLRNKTAIINAKFFNK